MFGELNIQRWRSATRCAHAALEANDLPAATRLLHDAVHEAEQLLFSRYEDLPVPRIYVVSCHQLADSYRRLDRPELASQIISDAHHRLADIVRDTNLPLSLRRASAEEMAHSSMPDTAAAATPAPAAERITSSSGPAARL